MYGAKKTVKKGDKKVEAKAAGFPFGKKAVKVTVKKKK